MARSDRRTCPRLESRRVLYERKGEFEEIKILGSEINAKFLIFEPQEFEREITPL